MADLQPRVLVRDLYGNEREVGVSGSPFSIGRQADNDLVLLDNGISRRHATIEQRPDGFYLLDSQSRFGTTVNGERIQERLLRSGDEIRLGVSDSYLLVFLADQFSGPNLRDLVGKVSASPAEQLRHLNLLLEVAQMLCKIPALDEVIKTVVDSALQITNTERGLLFLRDDEGNLQLRLAHGKGGVELGTAITDYSREVVEKVAASGREEVVLEDTLTGKASNETGIIQGLTRSIVAVPLQKASLADNADQTGAGLPQMLGVLYLESTQQAASLTGLDRQVLQTLAFEGATVIENARMFRLSREQEKMQRELDVARSIQQGLLPRELPQSSYFEAAAFTIPTQTVGGDYYDLIPLPGDRCAFSVADVSGKGLSAAMLATTLQGAFAALAGADLPLEELFSRANAFLCARVPMGMYATLFYGVLDWQGTFQYVNAGHAQPLLVRAAGAMEPLLSSSLPLGLFSGVSFLVDTVHLQLGDKILIYSDGVTDSRNAAGDLFGDERLRSIWEWSVPESPRESCQRILSVVHAFVGTAPQADDLTLLALRYGAP
jgi:phosphoserine phosphatase RsbU/P